MEFFRITQEKYAADLSGNGSRLYGGRWNNEGLFAVYTSSSRSLALLETLAHTPAKMLQSKSYFLITLNISITIVPAEILLENLEEGWNRQEGLDYTKFIGDQFLKNKSGLALTVPSALVPEEKNILLNPLHKDMKKVRTVHKRRIYFDTRIETGI